MKAAWKSPGVAAALLVLLTLVAYIPVLRGEFVWDDSHLITENSLIKASDGLYRFWFTTDAPDYYPLTWSLWWLEWRLWRESTTGYHVVNVLLHGVNAALAWIILKRLKIPGAWLAALVFAVHPVNVATVAWISEQKNTLSMFFFALTILFYLRLDEQSRWRWYGLSLAAFLLALLSKSAVVMLPVVLLGCMWWRHGRVRRTDLLRSVPFFALALLLGLVTVWFQHHRVLLGQIVRPQGFLSRLATAGCAPWFYLYKALLPVNLTVIYPKWDMDVSHWISYVPGIMIVSCLALIWSQRRTWGRPALFGLGYFVTMLVPVLGFFDQGLYEYSFVADHWQYYSVIGLIALLIGTAVTVCRRAEWLKHLGMVVGAAMLIGLWFATWQRARIYATAEELWQDNVTKNPSAWIAYNNLGTALLRAGKLVEAVGHFEHTLRIRPDYPGAHKNLGIAFFRQGRTQEAMMEWKQALQINPDDPETHNNLGLLLYRRGEISVAIGHYEQAIRIKPDFAEAHCNLGLAFAGSGRLPEALGQWEEAVRIKPDYAEAYYNLGLGLAQLGRLPEAIQRWEQTLQFNPDYAEAHYNLGVVWEKTGHTENAMGHYEQALRLKPGHAEAQNKLAQLRARHE